MADGWRLIAAAGSLAACASIACRRLAEPAGPCAAQRSQREAAVLLERLAATRRPFWLPRIRPGARLEVEYARRVLFEQRLQRGLANGSIRLAFRRWRQPQVVSGRLYRSPIGMVAVDGVTRVNDEISLDDARAAGYTSVADLLGDLRGPAGAALYRLELRAAADADPRQALAAQGELQPGDIQQLRARLARLDAVRPWTTATLEAIQRRPGTRAGDLYLQLGWPDLPACRLPPVRARRGVPAGCPGG